MKGVVAHFGTYVITVVSAFGKKLHFGNTSREPPFNPFQASHG